MTVRYRRGWYLTKVICSMRRTTHFRPSSAGRRCGASALVVGPEGTQNPARGLQRRIEDVALLDERIGEFIDAIVDAAHILPGPG